MEGGGGGYKELHRGKEEVGQEKEKEGGGRRSKEE